MRYIASDCIPHNYEKHILEESKFIPEYRFFLPAVILAYYIYLSKLYQ